MNSVVSGASSESCLRFVSSSFSALGQFVCRGHQEHVALGALAESLGAQDQVQRLVPRHVLEP